MPESNACQLVLKYILSNKGLFIKSYHDRMYFFSSGTKFSIIVGPLHDWQRTQERACTDFKNGDLDTDVQPPNPNTLLKRLSTDHAGMYGLLGDALIKFIELKPQPYGKYMFRIRSMGVSVYVGLSTYT